MCSNCWRVIPRSRGAAAEGSKIFLSSYHEVNINININVSWSTITTRSMTSKRHSFAQPDQYVIKLSYKKPIVPPLRSSTALYKAQKRFGSKTIQPLPHCRGMALYGTRSATAEVLPASMSSMPHPKNGFWRKAKSALQNPIYTIYMAYVCKIRLFFEK